MHSDQIPDFLKGQDLGEFPLRRSSRQGSLWRIAAAAGLVGATLGVAALVLTNSDPSASEPGEPQALASALMPGPSQPVPGTEQLRASQMQASAPQAAAPLTDPVTVASIGDLPKIVERPPVAAAPAPVRAAEPPAPPVSSERRPEAALPASTVPTPAAPASPVPTSALPAGAEPRVAQPVRSNPAEVQAQLDRAERLLKAGDLASARLFFERVAAGGDPRGALGMAKSYDDTVLRTLPVVGLRGDSGEAARWYREAEKLGARSPGRSTAAR